MGEGSPGTPARISSTIEVDTSTSSRRRRQSTINERVSNVNATVSRLNKWLDRRTSPGGLFLSLPSRVKRNGRWSTQGNTCLFAGLVNKVTAVEESLRLEVFLIGIEGIPTAGRRRLRRIASSASITLSLAHTHTLRAAALAKISGR